MKLPFAKLQAAGNGYIAFDARGLDLDLPALARWLCDPHLGIGSDGLAVVAESSVAPVRMRILNSDGSESEMSGNGIRLFAKYVLDRGLVRLEAGALRIETGGGLRVVHPDMEAGRMRTARVEMGDPTFDAAAIPVRGDGIDPGGRVFDHSLDLRGGALAVTCLQIGNPHAVALLDTPVDEFPLEEIGPQVMNHRLFPNRINFEIVNVIDRATIRARIFERGEGETLASGTGSTASMIAAHLHGRVDDDVRVLLRGGELRIRWSGAGEALLEGPAEEVFEGVVTLPDTLR